MSASVDRQTLRQTVFLSDSRWVRTHRRVELLLFVAQRSGFVFEKEAARLKQTCRSLRDLNFTAKRALRLELFTPSGGGLRLANLFSFYWHYQSQTRWSELPEGSPAKAILSASSCVNLNIYWRTYNEDKSKRIFRNILVCNDVAFNQPTAIAVTKIWEVFKKGQFKKLEGSLGTFVYLKFLGADPNNLGSVNRVEGSAKAITSFLLNDAKDGGFKGVYLEALPAAVEIFKRLGFEPLDKGSIEMSGSPLRCQPMIRLHDRADAAFKFS